MNINQIKAAAEIAKSRTSDKRWLAAIDKAVAGFESWIITELQNCLAITTESGHTYFSNGTCQCEAYKRSTACKHRALYRLYAIAQEIEETAPVAVSDAEVETAFAAKFPGYHIADYLLKFYGQNSLRFMNRNLVADIHALILTA